MVEVDYKYPHSLVSGTLPVSQNVSLREGDSVIIRCRPDSNPPASVAWRRAGEMGVWSTQSEVLIENVGRENGGIYTCTAHNRLGVSGPKEIVLNVECKLRNILTVRLTEITSDSPHIVSLEPSGKVSSQIGNRVSLSCLADANPQPAYQWVQRLNDQVIIRGNSRVLQLDNIIFEVRTERRQIEGFLVIGYFIILGSSPHHPSPPSLSVVSRMTGSTSAPPTTSSGARRRSLSLPPST